MERVWLYNPDTEGFFHCPADALDYWLGMGWQMSEPPPEENLAVAERRAWEKQQAEQAEAAEAAKSKKSTKPAASGEPQESCSMADIVSDGRTRVYYVASISNTAAPTVAELNAGIRLDQLITADGYVGFRPETADVPTTPLSGTFNTNRNGRVSFSGTMLRLKKQDGTDTVYDTLVKDTTGYIVERRSTAAGTAWAAGQKVKVFPFVAGETAWIDPEENTLERYEVPIKMTDQPNLRATVA